MLTQCLVLLLAYYAQDYDGIIGMSFGAHNVFNSCKDVWLAFALPYIGG